MVSDNPGQVPSPHYQLTFTRVQDGKLHYVASVGPMPANFAAMNLAFDFGKQVFDRFSFAGTNYRQEQDFFELRIGSAVVMTDGLEQEEAAVIDGHRWWTVADLEATTEVFYPRDLPRLLRELAARALGAT